MSKSQERHAMLMRAMLLPLLLALATALTRTHAAPDLDKWQGRSVYFVVTDRFARDVDANASDGSGGSVGLEVCGDGTKDWCGGTFKGVMSKLDYIAGMGFDALWITPVVKQVTWRDNWNGTGYHGARTCQPLHSSRSIPATQRRTLLLPWPELWNCHHLHRSVGESTYAAGLLTWK
jgi:hypothetical protein